MIFCIPFWIIAISNLCAPLTGLVTMVGEMFMMRPMMDAIFESMIPFIEQMAEMGATG